MLLNLYTSINSVMQKRWLGIQNYLKDQCQLHCFYSSVDLWVLLFNNYLLLNKSTLLNTFWQYFSSPCVEKVSESIYFTFILNTFLCCFPDSHTLVLSLFFLIKLGKLSDDFDDMYWTSWYFLSTLKNVKVYRMFRIINVITLLHSGS